MDRGTLTNYNRWHPADSKSHVKSRGKTSILLLLQSLSYSEVHEVSLHRKENTEVIDKMGIKDPMDVHTLWIYCSYGTCALIKLILFSPLKYPIVLGSL